MMTGADESLLTLVKELTDRGSLTAAWRPSFLAIPRRMFIPDTIWWEASNGDLVSVSRSDDPDRWRDLVARNDSVITQVDDGHPTRPDSAGWLPTSSASMPTMVAAMLAHLDAKPGHRVLEIGTGTGWNAALLAHRLGAEQVTSIEIDPDLAAHARTALAGAGFGAVTVITADGALGHPPDAPYDRVISTASCQTVPYAWVAQTRPGGRILTPWGNPYFDGGLLALTTDHQGTASGGIIGKASFMYLRDQRIPRAPLRDILGTAQERAALPITWTDIHPYQVAGRFDTRFAIALRVSHCKFIYSPYDIDDEDGQHRGVVWFVDPWSRSWASLTHLTPDASDDHFAVQQHGPRQLFDEIETAYRWWINTGSPSIGQWCVTITPHGQRIDLHGPVLPKRG